MYGYVVPIKEKLKNEDFCLYRAFYCGICKGTGKYYGQLPRFTTNYDIVFLSVLLHDYTSQEVIFENSGCVCNPFKKKTTVLSNELFDKLIATNIIMSFYKASDDVLDRGGLKKKFVRGILSSSYKKAKANLPQIDKIVKIQYDRLNQMERENVSGVDRVADCFATMLMQIADELLDKKATEPLSKLCYNVGKFVYIADALDDIDEDFKKKNYNPLLTVFGNYENRVQFLTDNNAQLQFLLATTINRAIECFNKMCFTGASDLLMNIVHLGLRGKAEEIFKSSRKLDKPKI